MSKPVQAIGQKAVGRSRYRRLLFFAALIIVILVAGWMVWGAIQEYLDARNLKQYLADLEQREPNWRDRVYGKELTEQQHQDHDRWKDIEKWAIISDPSWSYFHSGFDFGIRQNASEPNVLLSPEQAAFIEALHQHWKPLSNKLAAEQQFPPLHRWIDRNAPYMTMIRHWYSQYPSHASLLNCVVEVETLRHIQNGNARQAIEGLSRYVTATASINENFPYLLERWLNLTQPDQNDLVRAEKLIASHREGFENRSFQDLGSEIRLLEKYIHELHEGKLTDAELDRLYFAYALVPNQSPMRIGWLQFARPYFLKWRVHNLFRRRDHIVTRLHQLADRVEALPRLSPGTSWKTWHAFAREQLIDQSFHPGRKPDIQDTELVPAGLFLLRASYLHVQVANIFNQCARLRAVQTALVAERFRLDRGQYPKEWSDLVPAYLPQPLLDPFTGMPLLLKQRDNKLVIYSLGRDGKDHGGANVSQLHSWILNAGNVLPSSNIGVQLVLPVHRRSPPAPMEDNRLDELKRTIDDIQKLSKTSEVDQ